MDAAEVSIQLILQGGAVGLLAVVALMVFMGWLVPSRTYRTLERDRDYWRQVAMKALGQAEVLIPAAEITTQFTRALAGAIDVAKTGAEAAAAKGGDRT